MKVVTDKVGGRKYTLILSLTLLFMVFGVYCVESGVSLSEGAAFIAAVGGTAYGYFHQNVRQKMNGGGHEGS